MTLTRTVLPKLTRIRRHARTHLPYTFSRTTPIDRLLNSFPIMSRYPLTTLLTVLLTSLLAAFALADISLFSNPFMPDSIMGAGPNTRLPPSNTPHGLSDQSAYVSLSSSGSLIAVGDFNRDRFIDLVMLDSRSLRRLGIMLWDHDAYSFKHAGAGIVMDDWKQLEKDTSFTKITGVHVADFGNDGTLDILVMDGTQGWLFFGDGAGNFNASKPVIIPDLPAATSLVDADADFVPEIFAAFPNGTRGFWQHQRAKPVEEDREDQSGDMVFRKWNGPFSRSKDGNPCDVVDPVSIAFADLDGDCLPDLVVPTSCGVEVWSNPSSSNRKFWQLKVNDSAGISDMRDLENDVFDYKGGDRSIALTDFDGDGTIDLAIPNIKRKDLYVYLNIQAERGVGNLCVKDARWKLERRIGLTRNQVNIRSIRIGPLFGGIEIPPSLHIGDYDLDGNPDILVIDGGSSKPILFRNSGTWRHGEEQKPHFTRIDRSIEEGLSKDNGGAIAATFFDTDESGRQDILVVKGGNETRLIWNNLQEGWDTLFFKGTMLSGLGYHLYPRPFAPLPGNTLKLSYMERGSNHRVTRACSQCPQSGHWQLRLCNCQFGLMNIANYIEELWAGGGAASRSWVSLMPNSMAVIWAEGGNNASSWWMEYFTQRRGSQMLRVTAVLLLSLVALGLAIIFLQQKERKDDLQEDEQERLFSFV